MNTKYVWLTMLLGISLLGCETTKPNPPISEQKQQTVSENQTAKQADAPTRENQETTQTSTDSHNDKQVVFPKLVKEGMSKFVSKTKTPLLAPLVIPAPKSEQTTMAVKSWDLGPSQPSYNVEFTQNTSNKDFKPIAGFSGTAYVSKEELINSFSGVSGLGDPTKLQNGMTGQIKTGSIDLSDKIKAKTYQYNTDQESAKHINHYGSIVWQEGRWTIEVMNTGIDTLPVDTAKQAVAYLAKNYLPAPETKGAIVIDMQPTIQPSETHSIVTWDKGEVLYQTTSFETASSLAAIEMAVSMHPYP